MQLREKQKVRRIYGVLERQFRNTYHRAEPKQGRHRREPAAAARSRLDTSPIAWDSAPPAPRRARSCATTAILVNGKRVNMPSFIVRPGDVVEVAEKAKNAVAHQGGGRGGREPRHPEWLEVDAKTLKGTFKARPQRSELPSTINESLVVELYSK